MVLQLWGRVSLLLSVSYTYYTSHVCYTAQVISIEHSFVLIAASRLAVVRTRYTVAVELQEQYVFYSSEQYELVCSTPTLQSMCYSVRRPEG